MEHIAITAVTNHSPGQRQFFLESKYRGYFMGNYIVRGGTHSGNVAAANLPARLVQARSQDGLPVVQQVRRQAKRGF